MTRSALRFFALALPVLLGGPAARAAAGPSGAWAPAGATTWPSPVPRRFGSACAYDGVHREMWIFGGYDGTSFLNDVWVRPAGGAGTWTQVIAAGAAPSSRVYSTWVFDAAADRLVLFGGAESAGIVGDTWQLDLSGTPTWSQLSPTGTAPGGRYIHDATLDPVRDRMLVFGGADNFGLTNDCWALDLSPPTPVWSQIVPSGALPPARSWPSIVYDPADDRLVLFGGNGSLSGEAPHPLQDTWSLNLSGAPAWTPASPPGALAPARRGQRACYDSALGRMIVVGGNDGSVYLNDCWALDLSGAMGWAPIQPLDPRADFALVFDPDRDRLVLFGGKNASGVLGDDLTLALDSPGNWLSSLGARLSHKAVYDPAGHDMYVFGGTTVGSSLNDLYRLHLDPAPTWSLVAPQGTPPPPRDAHAQVMDVASNRMIVFGGLDMPTNYRRGRSAAGPAPKTASTHPLGGA